MVALRAPVGTSCLRVGESIRLRKYASSIIQGVGVRPNPKANVLKSYHGRKIDDTARPERQANCQQRVGASPRMKGWRIMDLNQYIGSMNAKDCIYQNPNCLLILRLLLERWFTINEVTISYLVWRCKFVVASRVSKCFLKDGDHFHK